MNRQKKTWAKKESRIQDRTLSSVDIHRIWFPIRKNLAAISAVLPNDSRGYKSSASRLRQADHMLTCLRVYMRTCVQAYILTIINLCIQLTCVYKLICVHCTMLGWHNIEQVANRCPECQTPGNCTIFCFQIQYSNTAPAWVAHIRCDKKIRNGFKKLRASYVAIASIGRSPDLSLMPRVQLHS